MTPLIQLQGVGKLTAAIFEQALGVSTCEELKAVDNVTDKVLQSEAYTNANKRSQATVRRALSRLTGDFSAEPPKKKRKTPPKQQRNVQMKETVPMRDGATEIKKPELPRMTPNIEVERLKRHIRFDTSFEAAFESAKKEIDEDMDDSWVLLRIGWEFQHSPHLHSVMSIACPEVQMHNKELDKVLKAAWAYCNRFQRRWTRGPNKLLIGQRELLGKMLPSNVFRLRKRTSVDDVLLTIRPAVKYLRKPVPEDVLRLIGDFAAPNTGRSLDELKNVDIEEMVYAQYKEELTKLADMPLNEGHLVTVLQNMKNGMQKKIFALVRAVARVNLEVHDLWRYCNAHAAPLKVLCEKATLRNFVRFSESDSLNAKQETSQLRAAYSKASRDGRFDVYVKRKSLLQYAEKLGMLYCGSKEYQKYAEYSRRVCQRVEHAVALVRLISTSIFSPENAFETADPTLYYNSNYPELQAPLDVSVDTLMHEIDGLTSTRFDKDMLRQLARTMPVFMRNTLEFHRRGLHNRDHTTETYALAVQQVVQWLMPEGRHSLPAVHTFDNFVSLMVLVNMIRAVLPHDDSKVMQNADQELSFDGNRSLFSLCRIKFSSMWSTPPEDFIPEHDLPTNYEVTAASVSSGSFDWLIHLLGGAKAISLWKDAPAGGCYILMPTFSSTPSSGSMTSKPAGDLKHRSELASILTAGVLLSLLGESDGSIDLEKMLQRHLLRDVMARRDVLRSLDKDDNAQAIIDANEMMYDPKSYVMEHIKCTEDDVLWPVSPVDESVRAFGNHIGELRGEAVPVLRRHSSLLTHKHDLSPDALAIVQREFPDSWKFFDYQKDNIANLLHRERQPSVQYNIASMLSPLPGRLHLPRMSNLEDDLHSHGGLLLPCVVGTEHGVLYSIDVDDPSLLSQFDMPGGLLADQVGLGKTAQMLAVCAINDDAIFGNRERRDKYASRCMDPINKRGSEAMQNLRVIVSEDSDEKEEKEVGVTLRRIRSDATLILCPSHLCAQWESECRRLLSSCDAEQDIVVCAKPRSLARVKGFAMLRARFVIVSFAAMQEFRASAKKKIDSEFPPLLRLIDFEDYQLHHCLLDEVQDGLRLKKNTALLPNHIQWRRVIVDECHELYNEVHSSTSLSLWTARTIHADYRWLCTGTPGACLQHMLPHMLDAIYGDTSYSYDEELRQRILHKKNEKRKSSTVLPGVEMRFMTLLAFNLARNGVRRHTQWTAESESYLPDFEEIEERYALSPAERVLVENTTGTETAVAMIQHSLVHASGVHLGAGESLSKKAVDLPLQGKNSGSNNIFFGGNFSLRQIVVQRIEHLRASITKLREEGKSSRSVVYRRAVAALLDILNKEHLEEAMKCRYDTVQLVPAANNLRFGGTKLTLIANYVDSILRASPTHRVIVFSTTRSFMRLLQHALAMLHHSAAVVMYSYTKRQRALQCFREGVKAVREATNTGNTADIANKYPRVLILNVESAASGLDILGVSHVVLADVLFGRTARAVQAQETQAIARALRQSRDEDMRDRKLVVKRFLAAGTVEEAHYNRLVQNLQALEN